jgi:hypothetical protein
MRTHDWIERRSLALHSAVAEKLEADPTLVAAARENLVRWIRASPSPALAEWDRLLATTPIAGLVQLLRSPAQDAVRLRQSSPFAGLLSPPERQAILRAHDPRRT